MILRYFSENSACSLAWCHINDPCWWWCDFYFEKGGLINNWKSRMSQSLRNKLVPQRKDRLPVTLILTCYIKLQVPGSWSSCRSSGSSHTTEASTLPFFERQREALCGLHALNSALGAETFLLACNLYLQESEDPRRSTKRTHGGGSLLVSQFFSQCTVPPWWTQVWLPSAGVCLGREAGLAVRAVLAQPRFDGQRAVDMGIMRSPIREIAFFFWRIACEMLGASKRFCTMQVSKCSAGF